MSFHSCSPLTMLSGSDICVHTIFESILNNKLKENILTIKKEHSLYTIVIHEEGLFYQAIYNGITNVFYKNPKVVTFKGKEKKQIAIFTHEEFDNILNTLDLEEGIFYADNFVEKSIKDDCKLFFESPKITTIFRSQINKAERQTFYTNKQNIKSNNNPKLTSLINYSNYYKKITYDKDFDSIFKSTNRINLLNSLYYHNYQTGKTFFFTGPSGIGKSVTLMYFTIKYMSSISSCYFNIQFMHNTTSSIILKSIFTKAISTLYLNQKDYCEDINKLLSINMSQSIWDILTELFLLLKKDNSRHVIIIDQYKKEYDEDNYKNLKKLIGIIKDSSLSLVVCSSINEYDIRECLIQQWNEIPTTFPYVYIPEILIIKKEDIKDKSNDIQKAIELFSYLPKYSTQILGLETDIDCFISNQKHIIKGKMTNFYNNDKKMFIKLIKIKSVLDKTLTKDEFNIIIPTVPLKYFKVIQNGNCFIIKPHFNLILEILEEMLLEKSNTLQDRNELFDNLEDNDTYKGIVFELFFHLKMIIEKKPFTNLYFQEIVYVYDLLECNLWPSLQTKKSQNSKDSFYIIPKKQNSAYFDSAIIHKYNEQHLLITFQVTIGKSNSKMMNRESILTNLNKLRSSIQKQFNISIEEKNMYFFYVFKLDAIRKSNVRYCINHDIPMLFFSVKHMQFSLIEKEADILVNIAFPYSFTFLKYHNNSFLKELQKKCQQIEAQVQETFLNKKTSRSPTKIEEEKILELIQVQNRKMQKLDTTKKVFLGYMETSKDQLYILYYKSKRYAVYQEKIVIEIDGINTKKISKQKKEELFYEYPSNHNKDNYVEWYKLSCKSREKKKKEVKKISNEGEDDKDNSDKECNE